VAGDDEPVALPDRQFVAEIRALTDARAKLDRYAHHLVDTHARQAQVVLALAAAATADLDAAAIWRKTLDDRRTGMTMVAADLASTGQLRPEHTVDTPPTCCGWAWTCATTTGSCANAAGPSNASGPVRRHRRRSASHPPRSPVPVDTA
jgi:hypothetical protein